MAYINILKKRQDRDLRQEELRRQIFNQIRNQGSGHSGSDRPQSECSVSTETNQIRNQGSDHSRSDPEELYNMSFPVCHRKDSDSTEQDENDSETYPEMYPEDAYSFLTLNGPTTNLSWPFQKFVFFLFGLVPFLFQIMLLGLLVSKFFLNDDPLTATGAEGEATKEEKIPVDVMMARIVSLAAYLLFPSSTQRGLIKALQLYLWCDSAIEDIPAGCSRLSCTLRFTQSNLAITVVFLLIMKSEDTLEIILNFTAVNFISNLEDDAFYIAKSGILGSKFMEEAKRIGKTKLPSCMHRKSKRISCSVMLATYAAIFLSLMIALMTVNDEDACSKVLRGMVQFQCGVSSVLLLYSVVISLYGACCSRGSRRESPQGFSRQDSQKTVRTSTATSRRSSFEIVIPEDFEQTCEQV